ncbi:hypothetical protein PLICRDRAFT_57401 [Plicaturopsis crispa FD-325 SS-3]|uniref:Signal peptidase complex subunit 1 n=1 Tax=Plicaturopsis crispa FD-325 SS-3 TaxID=944288 RepID=A0A0C9T9G1_PLICR|nr:hypothetical protein PLICRDRAFT_57401 [Plicaturopsis crispa FD-325 SS-3]
MDLSFVHEALEGKIDFEGQQLVDQIARNGLIGITATSFLTGFALQSLRVAFGVLGLGFVVILVAVVPPWSIYNSSPVQWLPAIPTEEKKKTK